MTAKKSTPAVLRKRERVLDQMTDSLKTIYTRINTKLNDDAKKSILTRFDVGESIAKVKGDERKYGERAMAQLSEALGYKESVLYSYAQIATTYTRERLEQFMNDMEKAGGYLSYSQVRLLITVDNVKLREQLEKRLVAELLTADQLTQIVQAKAGKRSNNSGPLAPRSPMAGLQQMAKMSESLLDRQAIYQKSIFDQLSAIEPDKVTEKLIEQLEDTDTKQKQLEQFCGENRRKLDVILDKVRQVHDANEAEKRPSRMHKDRAAKPPTGDGYEETMPARQRRVVPASSGPKKVIKKRPLQKA